MDAVVDRPNLLSNPTSNILPVNQARLVILAAGHGWISRSGPPNSAAMSLLPYFASDLRSHEPTAGHVISAYAAASCVGAPVIALLGARWSRRSLADLADGDVRASAMC